MLKWTPVVCRTKGFQSIAHPHVPLLQLKLVWPRILQYSFQSAIQASITAAHNRSFSTTSIDKSPKKENIFTLPNALTVFRIGLSPWIGHLILTQQSELALGVLVVAGSTDILDGWIARKFHLKTFLGSALDPMADKILMTVLVYSLFKTGALPFTLAGLVLGRDILLIAGTAYYRYISLEPPKTLSRYFDLALPSAEVRPPLISKINTFLQLGLMFGLVAGSAYDFLDSPWMTGLKYVTPIVFDIRKF